jgi:hypothetical protein
MCFVMPIIAAYSLIALLRACYCSEMLSYYYPLRHGVFWPIYLVRWLWREGCAAWDES